MAKASGLDGVIASPQETRMLRQTLGDNFLIGSIFLNLSVIAFILFVSGDIKVNLFECNIVSRFILDLKSFSSSFTEFVDRKFAFSIACIIGKSNRMKAVESRMNGFILFKLEFSPLIRGVGADST